MNLIFRAIITGVFLLTVVSFNFTSSLFAAPAVLTGTPKIFGTSEIRSRSLKKFKKWNGVLKRYNEEKATEAAACTKTPLNPCDLQRWRKFLDGIKKQPVRDQIEKVNAFMNKRQYIIDPINYGKRDYWATPKQFFNKNGDCEDYAISKYISLLHLGFSAQNMRIVILQDLNIKVAHAILVVYLNGEALVLDNQIAQVVNANRIRHYKPIYSINHTNWWLHRG